MPSIAGPGGPFSATKGLLDRFGPTRVRDTPISEAAIVGAAVGAAMSGLRPVVEIMFMDFTTLAMNAIVNQAAKARFMFGGQCSVPMVLRAPHGGGINAGPQHSQCLGVRASVRRGTIDRRFLLRTVRRGMLL